MSAPSSAPSSGPTAMPMLVLTLTCRCWTVWSPVTRSRRAVAMATALRDRVTGRQTVQHRQVSVSTSIGIAVGPDDGADEGALMQHADVALYLAKASPQGVALYEADLDPNSPERLELINDLRKAVRQRELRLSYQPVVNTVGGEVAHVEALARWPLDDGRALAASEFIPLAEECG